MSQYNWSKRYQIPDVCFKTERNSYRSKESNNKLRQTIDVSIMRNDNSNIKKDSIKQGYPQSLRHTTDYSTNLTDLLGKSYKYFQPRPSRLKIDLIKNTKFDECSSKNYQSYKPYQPSVNSTWSGAKFKSMKDIKEAEIQSRFAFDKGQKLWSSSKQIHAPFAAKQITTSQRMKEYEQCDSPNTFAKKQKFLQMTPQPYKRESDGISTKIGSPASSSEKIQMKFSSLKEIKIDPINFLTLKDFVTIKHLGQGRFGTVSMAIHKFTGSIVAIKKVKKAVIKSHKLENQFIMEMKMQLFLKHPNILKLYGYFDDSQNIYLILEFMEEGTLYNKLKKQKLKHFDQMTASQKMDDILHAVKYMHELQIAHRDIKPENIVISNGICKLCDFGWAAVCQNRRTTLCGTIDYAPPQVLEGKEYGLTMDLWCLGILCYQLLVGKAPFYHVSRKQTMQKIIKADTNDLKLPEQLSKQAVDFITKMLIKDPEERMFAEDALQHQFILNHIQSDDQKFRGKYR